jgi:deazaflavin-dependent oxidoreductase (nitroreductase family)
MARSAPSYTNHQGVGLLGHYRDFGSREHDKGAQPLMDRTAKYLSSFHRVLYRTTGGVVGRRLVDNDMCLLTTTGRRSGNQHTVPLLYLSDDERLLVIASWGGRDEHPHWYLNLLTDPAASVQILNHRWQVTATTASPTERAAWWPKVLDAYDGYAEYESRTDREIPVVFLDPAAQVL